MKDFLSKIDLFKGLQDHEYQFIELNSDLVSFGKDELVFEAGNLADSLFLIENGLVKMYKIRKGSQKEEIVCLVRSGEYFCLAPILSRDVFHISARTIEASKIVQVPKETINTLIRKSHAFSQNVIRNLACMECSLCESVCDLSLSTTKERLAKYLVKEFEENPMSDAIPMPLNQTQLASYLGTVRETLSRDLASLKKARIIADKKGKIIITDFEALKQVAGKK